MKTRSKLFFVVCMLATMLVNAQNQHYQYVRPLPEVLEGWHEISLPNALFGRLQKDMDDMRIFGIKANGDTIEVPYFISSHEEKVVDKIIDFQLLNQAQQAGRYFFTFKLNALQPVDEIELDFHQENFDWKLMLEGSHDQQSWFAIVSNYRILSIKNSETDYQFTKVKFPTASYLFYRVQITSETTPKLSHASVVSHDTVEGRYRDHKPISIDTREDKSAKTTVVDIDLGMEVPVNRLFVDVLDQFDFYRPTKISYIADSFHTEKGWKYSNSTLGSGTLSSMEPSSFSFESTIARKLRLVIQNHDNAPLHIGDCQAFGYDYALLARFGEKADYALYYGNPEARKPVYDIIHFKDDLPELASQLILGDEQTIALAEISGQKPLFENKLWLWVIMLAIIGLLGYFSLKMLNSKG